MVDLHTQSSPGTSSAAGMVNGTLRAAELPAKQRLPNGTDMAATDGTAARRSGVVVATADNIAELLAHDTKVQIAGVDCDGVLRGKVIAKDKFLSGVANGVAMSSAIFGWDMHDELHNPSTSLATAEQGYADILAFPDLSTFRRLPFDDDGLPFVLVSFGAASDPLPVCGRSMMRSLSQRLHDAGCRGLAGVELEFMNFRTPTEAGYNSPERSANIAAFLKTHSPKSLETITDGMFGYSVTRPVMNKRFFRQLFDQADQFRCGIEGLHTESGPGVVEAALRVSPLEEMADKVTLFKLLAKSIGVEENITPCFMAKPLQNLPGNSGHIHVSLVDHEGRNLFARDTVDANAPWDDIAGLSDLGRHFLAGLLDGLPDLMPVLAPTVNSYKRLVENYWAPVDVSWGLEHRLSSIRLIAPPVGKPSATRFEVRIPGADLHPHYALLAIVAAGWRGVEKKLAITVPPSATRAQTGEKAALLPNTLVKALERFRAPGSVAREVLGDAFVDFYTATREHELRLWREAVTDWEFVRYIENI
ncbi:Glutamine synthetase/guanido kinase, catalytic domain protein [Niveomyces insectorum RCEF 264]|uniref:Glutamine synthetase n=1 Tax=Niveomyces insectorum RCEF 264 TaxID=1081102 RepID=A0A167XAZ0_9HYPO|nr:Glutamine synthetase/guanido kinase, catalytic domain protein [Niveomyces insectorum RCEF 264]